MFQANHVLSSLKNELQRPHRLVHQSDIIIIIVITIVVVIAAFVVVLLLLLLLLLLLVIVIGPSGVQFRE